MVDGVVEAVVEGAVEAVGSEGCANALIMGFNWFPLPMTLLIGSTITHALNETPAPILNSLQDTAAFYTGAAVAAVGMKMANVKPTFRNNLLATFAGCALFATSALAAPNYLEKWFGSDDKAKNKTEQTVPKTDSTSKKPAPAQW